MECDHDFVVLGEDTGPGYIWWCDTCGSIAEGNEGSQVITKYPKVVSRIDKALKFLDALSS